MQQPDPQHAARHAPTAMRRRGRPANNATEAVPEDRLLDLAFQAFAQRGYEATTLRALARQLGVSHNLLNVRFGSKARLWRRALDARIARIGGPVFAAFDTPGLNDDVRLYELIHRFCRWAAENPDFVSLVYAEGRQATWRLDYLVEAYVLPFKEKLEILLASIGAHRPVRSISTTALMAILVHGVGFYFAAIPLLERLQSGNEIDPAEIDGQSAIFADFILAGLLPDAKPATLPSGRTKQASCGDGRGIGDEPE